MLIKVAKNIAKKAHAGATDKAGVDYYHGHLTSVASVFSDSIHVAVAYLHDVIEDTHYDENSLLKELVDGGVSVPLARKVVVAVVAMTKKSNESYKSYLKRVKSNPISTAVKLSDLSHNSDLNRLSVVSTEDLKRVEKYKKAKAFLLNQ